MESLIAAGVVAAIIAYIAKDSLSSKPSADAYVDDAAEPETPPLSDTEIEILQSTWQQVVPIKEQAAELFYGRLFEIDPEVKPLFKGDMKQQGDKLMTSISTVINSVDKLDQVIPV